VAYFRDISGISDIGNSRGVQIPGGQVFRMTTCCAVKPNVSVSSVWNLLHVTILAQRILRWLLGFLKIYASLKMFPLFI
jgi:hypothetical protein